jgi:hypothetical protein
MYKFINECGELNAQSAFKVLKRKYFYNSIINEFTDYNDYKFYLRIYGFNEFNGL